MSKKRQILLEYNPRRLVIAASPRTGTTLLIRSLSQHPQCISSGEWFTFPQRRRPDCTLLKVWAHNQLQHPYFTNTLHSGKILFIYRKDRQAQINSWIKACTTGVWSSDQDPKDYNRQPVPDNPDVWIDLSHTLFSPVADLALPYETLVTQWDDCIRMILSLVGWDQIPLPKALNKLEKYK